MENNERVEVARQFCREVGEIGKKYNIKYNMSYFFVTEGASITCDSGCEAIKNARNNHIKWEIENGFDPNEDWSKPDSTEK